MFIQVNVLVKIFCLCYPQLLSLFEPCSQKNLTHLTPNLVSGCTFQYLLPCCLCFHAPFSMCIFVFLLPSSCVNVNLAQKKKDMECWLCWSCCCKAVGLSFWLREIPMVWFQSCILGKWRQSSAYAQSVVVLAVTAESRGNASCSTREFVQPLPQVPQERVGQHQAHADGPGSGWAVRAVEAARSFVTHQLGVWVFSCQEEGEMEEAGLWQRARKENGAVLLRWGWHQRVKKVGVKCCC